MPLSLEIRVGARSSNLSKAQTQEVLEEIQKIEPGITFNPLFVQTTGDLDKKTSLRTLEKTNFFTKELDELLLKGDVRITIHSAKDLPEPLPKGIIMAALTKGVDPSDALVFNEPLFPGAKVGTSSERRARGIKKLRNDLEVVDIRGTIEERLEMLKRKEVDALVIAQAALIRLNLTHLNRMSLPFEPAPLQGKLAVLARGDDQEMIDLFSKL